MSRLILSADVIEADLRAALPHDLRAYAHVLAQFVVDIANGATSAADVRSRLATDPTCAALVRALEGRAIAVGGCSIHFAGTRSPLAIAQGPDHSWRY
jgi:hypothetical protein